VERKHSRYGVEVLGVRCHRQPIADYEVVDLATADSLLVPAYKRRPLALFILAIMVLLSIFEIVPLVFPYSG